VPVTEVANARVASARPAGIKPTLAFRGGPIFRDATANTGAKWTAVVSADASLCTATQDTSRILFMSLKEIGPDIEFRERSGVFWRS